VKKDINLKCIPGQKRNFSSLVYLEIIGSTGMNPEEQTLPLSFSLEQNYPNPFNPETIINYSLPISCHTVLNIYDILGQKVKTLVNEIRPAGKHFISWDGLNDDGSPVSSGVYFYVISASQNTGMKKMMLIH
jgi:flagellar hook assembly protein FlgD